jgi:hypothetical protein
MAEQRRRDSMGVEKKLHTPAIANFILSCPSKESACSDLFLKLLV